MSDISRSSFSGSYGAQVIGPGLTRFRLWAPEAESVTVELQTGRSFPMQRLDDGWYEREIACAAGTRYKYRVGPDALVPDPASRLQVTDVRDESVVVDPHSYVWRNQTWRGRPWHETILYEVHVGAMGGFRGVLARLPDLAALGVTAIELMPIADFPGQHNWGYDGVLMYAPETSYGAPETLKALIDGAHDLGIQVFLDVVYNHFGPDGNFLNQYASSFFNPDLKSPWGAAIDFAKPQVRNFYIENALYWLEEYRFDGLRFDAVHAIVDSSFVTELGERIRSHFDAGRHIHLVLENDKNEARHLKRNFNAQWNDDLHHVLHVMLTGESRAYYAAYIDQAAVRLARCLKEGFGYQGEPSQAHQGAARGEPSVDLDPTCFVSFLQNHDQIGNRAQGERITMLASEPAVKAAVALILLSPQIPLLFMGEEWGCTKPFNYFVNQEGELAEAIRRGRMEEFSLAALPGEEQTVIPDPCELATYYSSIPQHPTGEEMEAASWLEFYRQMLGARHAHIIPRLVGARALDAVVLGDKAVKASWRMGDGAILSIHINLASEPVLIDTHSAGELGELLIDTRADAAASLSDGLLPGFTALAHLRAAG